MQASTEFSDSATIVSVDGVGAYDFVSRTAMLSGLLFQSVWDDEVGDTHEIRQGEGGEGNFLKMSGFTPY